MFKSRKYVAICLILMMCVFFAPASFAAEKPVKVSVKEPVNVSATIKTITALTVNWDAALHYVLITMNPAFGKEGIRLEYDTLNVTGIELPDAPGEPNYIGYYYEPYIFGLGSEKFESYVHKHLADAVTKPVREFEKEYNEFRAEIAAMDDRDALKKDLQMISGRYNYEAQTRLVTTAENYCAAAEVRFEDRGGAHPVTFVRAFNIDIPGEKFIKLGDIFKDGSYKVVIEKKLNEMAEADEYKEVLYDPREKIKIVDENDFYLTDGKLVIFYQQYEIAPYVAGFITFEIPLSEIRDILKDEYRTAVYKEKTSWEKLFEFEF